MTRPNDPEKGVFRLGQDLSLADIWIGLHSDAKQWQRAAFAPDTLRQRAAVADNTNALLAVLDTCEAARWQAFIEAQGITQIGAIALSWCKGADLQAVADGVLLDIEEPAQIDERAIRLFNPAMRPQSRSLMQLAEAVSYDIKALVLVALCDPAPIVMDVSTAWLVDLPPMLGAVLLKRYDPAVSKLQPEILETWQAAA
ncbi:hypothetical protein AB3Y40_00410 [Yoonia sp. R2331]|uniref:hypothetical protein n=1 Tax=Yoonia sp. R2331 TaxID=3237238 RepID=UPI0034E51D98